MSTAAKVSAVEARFSMASFKLPKMSCKKNINRNEWQMPLGGFSRDADVWVGGVYVSVSLSPTSSSNLWNRYFSTVSISSFLSSKPDICVKNWYFRPTQKYGGGTFDHLAAIMRVFALGQLSIRPIPFVCLRSHACALPKPLTKKTRSTWRREEERGSQIKEVMLNAAATKV